MMANRRSAQRKAAGRSDKIIGKTKAWSGITTAFLVVSL
jgi:hypothetical protein